MLFTALWIVLGIVTAVLYGAIFLHESSRDDLDEYEGKYWKDVDKH